MSQIQDTITGALGVSEWGVYFDHAIATCVEASEAVITGIYGVMPASQATDKWLAQDQISRGEADARGATNWANAGAQLTRVGVPNTAYGPDWFRSHNWVATVQAALARGIPVLFGVPRAFKLQDSVTGAQPDKGVFGHGLTIVGEDASGFLVADPNTAPGSPFMHYTAANLDAAGINSLVVPNASPQAVTSGGGGGGLIDFTQLEQWVGQQAMGAFIRSVLIFIALILLVVGLIVFFTGGSGRSATGAVGTAAGRAAGAAVFAA